MKICTICKENKDLVLFSKNKNKKDKLQSHCKDCNKKRSKLYYNKNLKKHRINTSLRKKRIINNSREYIYKYLLEHPCPCGETDPIVLQFDHLSNKKYSISYMLVRGHTLESIKEEIKKCQVLCANCHHKKTAKDFNWWTYNYSLSDVSSDVEHLAFNQTREESSPSRPTRVKDEKISK